MAFNYLSRNYEDGFIDHELGLTPDVWKSPGLWAAEAIKLYRPTSRRQMTPYKMVPYLKVNEPEYMKALLAVLALHDAEW